MVTARNRRAFLGIILGFWGGRLWGGADFNSWRPGPAPGRKVGRPNKVADEMGEGFGRPRLGYE